MDDERDFQLADEIEHEVTDRLIRRWSRNVTFGKQVLILAVSIVMPIGSGIAIYFTVKGEIKEAHDLAIRNRGTLEIIWQDYYGRKLPP